MAFEHLGYFKEYYISGKFIGSVMDVKKDREEIGYNGRRVEILTQEVVTSNNRKIKKNTTVTTILYPLNGKIIKRVPL